MSVGVADQIQLDISVKLSLQFTKFQRVWSTNLSQTKKGANAEALEGNHLNSLIKGLPFLFAKPALCKRLNVD